MRKSDQPGLEDMFFVVMFVWQQPPLDDGSKGRQPDSAKRWGSKYSEDREQR